MQYSRIGTKRVLCIPELGLHLFTHMTSRKSTDITIGRKCVGPIRWLTKVLLLSSIGSCFTFAGCQRFPGGQAMRQYQLESDRLLAEFRAQKKRAEDLEVRNGQLEQRLAESEKLLARNLGGTTGRITAGISNRGHNESELFIGDTRGDRGTITNLSDANSSRSSGRSPLKIQRGGLPDALPSTGGQLTAGNRNDAFPLGNGSKDLRGDPKSESQWRPVNRVAK